MDFLAQSEKLREEAKKRIAAKQITQTRLAQKMGIRPAVLSGFLGGKNFSLKRLNLLLHAMDLNVEDLYDRSPATASLDNRFIPLVKQSIAIEKGIVTPAFTLRMTGITYRVAEADANTNLSPRIGWDRFVAIKATRAHASFMHPVIDDGSTLILDRYFQQLVTTEGHPRIIYAVSDGGFLQIGYIGLIGKQLQLLPEASASLPIPITLGTRRDGPHIVGSVSTIVHHRRRMPAAAKS